VCFKRKNDLFRLLLAATARRRVSRPAFYSGPKVSPSFVCDIVLPLECVCVEQHSSSVAYVLLLFATRVLRTCTDCRLCVNGEGPVGTTTRTNKYDCMYGTYDWASSFLCRRKELT
jgi:hypothetical protein